MRSGSVLVALMFLSGSLAAQQAPLSWPPPDTAKATRDAQFARALEQIKGREDQPAESVYHEIRMMKGVPAGRLLRIMSFGFSRSLGVNCTFCHVDDQWDKEDSTRKQTARDMSAMVHTINDSLLKGIEGLKTKKERPIVNCTTCHRGQPKPALNLEPPPPH
jgi:hypothetical protein